MTSRVTADLLELVVRRASERLGPSDERAEQLDAAG
jgi:hypothetical protein